MKTKKHIIFDFDDTISSSYEHNQQLFVDTFLPHKPDIDQDYVRKVHYVSRGKPMLGQFEEVIRKFGLRVPAVQLEEENELLHQRRGNEVVIFDEFENILKHFKSLGKLISLCTNRAEGSLKIILSRNDLNKYFDNVISCRDAGHEKPDPYCLVKLLEKYPEIKKEDVIYFGDSKTDAEYAQNAGVEYLVIDHYLNKKQFYTLALGSFAGGEDELLVEVDKDNKDIGAIYKMVAHADPTRFHRAAHIMVFNSRGQVVLQKRAVSKMYDPGAWDMPGGHQSYGQTIDQAAEIELKEELGITSDLVFKKVWLKQDGMQSEYCYLYYTMNDGPYKYDEHEVADVRAFDCQNLLDHEYDGEFYILEHVYAYTEELRSVWEPLVRKE